MNNDQIIGQCAHGRQTLDNLKDPCPLCVAESKSGRPAVSDPVREGLDAIKGAADRYICPNVQGAGVPCPRCLSETSWCPGCATRVYLPAIENALWDQKQLLKAEASRDVVEKVLGYFPAHDQWGAVVAGHIMELDEALKEAVTEREALRDSIKMAGQHLHDGNTHRASVETSVGMALQILNSSIICPGSCHVCAAVRESDRSNWTSFSSYECNACGAVYTATHKM